MFNEQFGAADGGDGSLVECIEQTGGDGEQIAVGGQKDDVAFGILLQPLQFVVQPPRVRGHPPGDHLPLIALRLVEQHIGHQQGVLLPWVEGQQQPFSGGEMFTGVGQLQRHRHHVAHPGDHAVLGFVFREKTCPDRIGDHVEDKGLAVCHQTLGHGGGRGAKGVDVVVLRQFRQHLLAQHGRQRGAILIGIVGGDGGLIAKAGQLCPKARFGCGFAAPQHHGNREGVSW